MNFPLKVSLKIILVVGILLIAILYYLRNAQQSSLAKYDCSSTDHFVVSSRSPSKVQTVNDFMESEFCGLVHCVKYNDFSYGTDTPDYHGYLFSTDFGDMAENRVSIDTKGSVISHLMFSFPQRTNNQLCQGEKNLVTSLLKSFYPDGNMDSILEHVATDMGRESDISSDKPSYEWGDYYVQPKKTPDGLSLLLYLIKTYPKSK